jgi:hypothetical protein
MGTPLQDFQTAFATYKTAFEHYLKTEVYVWISQIRPTAGDVINPNEDFTFDVAVLNADAYPQNAMPLGNVRYDLRMYDSSIGALRVPASPMVARSGPLATDPELAPGILVKFMYLFPPDGQNTLEAGRARTITGLSGRAGARASATTDIRVRVLVAPDPAFVLSNNEQTPYASQELFVQPLND